ncbi:hypothetical protein A176_000902 [Myxococcus hansupus]|uniref:Uncharacterized protein n=1 Tax=Pseudomyxococcus hansupus TaxID=1297742 RepID=A0A0H4WRN6_9BACT|nr:hypothetical protein A176_000902 [Myxococcus hansupus]
MELVRHDPGPTITGGVSLQLASGACRPDRAPCKAADPHLPREPR